MKRVLFVCLGNICRSAMAQGILEHKAKIQGLNLEVDSAGTSSYHIGEAPDRRMQQKAIEHKLDISNQKARQFDSTDFNRFDYIFSMDSSNYEDIIHLTKDQENKDKVQLFLNFSYPNQNKNVPDPYYGRESGFEDVYQLLSTATDIFIDQFKNE